MSDEDLKPAEEIVKEMLADDAFVNEDPPMDKRDLIVGIGVMAMEAARVEEHELAQLLTMVAKAYELGIHERLTRMLKKMVEASNVARKHNLDI